MEFMGHKETISEIEKISRELYLLAPWTFMEETDLFSIITVSGNTFFVSIMGSAGEVFALSAYKGNEGLYHFWNLYNPGSEPESILTAPHLLLSFNDKNPDKDNPARPEPLSVNLNLPGATANVVNVIPGLFPNAPGDLELTDLREILEQSLIVCKRAAEDKYFLNPEENEDDVYLTRVHFEKNNTSGWHDKYIKHPPENIRYNLTWRKENVELLSKLKSSRNVFLVDLRILPKPVNDKSRPVYFPFLLLTIDRANGRIVSGELMEPFPDYNTMLSNIPARILELIIKLHFKPLSIIVKNRLFYEMLERLFTGTGIKIVLSPELPECDDAFAELIEVL